MIKSALAVRMRFFSLIFWGSNEKTPPNAEGAVMVHFDLPHGCRGLAICP